MVFGMVIWLALRRGEIKKSYIQHYVSSCQILINGKSKKKSKKKQPAHNTVPMPLPYYATPLTILSVFKK